MTRKIFVAGTLCIAAVCAGCQFFESKAQPRFAGNPTCQQPKLTVRFVGQPGGQFAQMPPASYTAHMQMVGPQPYPPMYDVQPQAQNLGHEGQAQVFNNQPQTQNFADQPMAQDFDHQPHAPMFDDHPPMQDFNHQPQAQLVEHQPQAGVFEDQPQDPMFNGGQPEDPVFFDDEPQAHLVEHQPMIMEGQSQAKVFEPMPQSQFVEGQPHTGTVLVDEQVIVNHQPNPQPTGNKRGICKAGCFFKWGRGCSSNHAESNVNTSHSQVQQTSSQTRNGPQGQGYDNSNVYPTNTQVYQGGSQDFQTGSAMNPTNSQGFQTGSNMNPTNTQVFQTGSNMNPTNSQGFQTGSNMNPTNTQVYQTGPQGNPTASNVYPNYAKVSPGSPQGYPPDSYPVAPLFSTYSSGGLVADRQFTAVPGQQAFLWGGGYNGANVTLGPTYLTTGAYSFAYFEPNRQAAYQGWIAVNNGGDDVLSALTEWRDTIHTQEEWLAFEYKIHGKYKSHNPSDFNNFQGQLTGLRRLEAKINAAIAAEQMDRHHMCEWQKRYLGDAQVLLMPGMYNAFAHPVTMPVFQPAELSTVLDGQPVTKVILAGDFQRAMEKVDRLTDLQQEMRRNRAVLAEEINRLENRRAYFRLTAHLHNDDYNFVENEQRVQQARGMLAKIDRQITDNRRHGHAVLALVGLFAPDEAKLALEREQTDVRGERAVLAERLHQIEIQFDDASMWNEKRVSLERQRQSLLAQIDECNVQLAQIQLAGDVVTQLRDSTGVIYRKGPATVVAASYLSETVPPRLAHAIEQEAMMTIRLQSAEGVKGTDAHMTEGEALQKESFILTTDLP